MIRVKVTKSNKQYQAGETLYLSKNEAFSLIDSGHAVISKDMTQTDMKTKKVKNGRSR